MYSIHSVEKCISELLKSGVDKSIIQKVFSSSFKVFLIMHDQQLTNNEMKNFWYKKNQLYINPLATFLLVSSLHNCFTNSNAKSMTVPGP